MSSICWIRSMINLKDELDTLEGIENEINKMDELQD